VNPDLKVPWWALKRPKSVLQHIWDFVGSPLRMTVLPDSTCENMRLTSLRAERFGVVLPALKGRVLDVGAGDNVLVHLYREYSAANGGDKEGALASVGVDIFDWGGDTVLIESSDKLPFEDNSFDTVTFIACINHIPERDAALAEVKRILKPGGRVVITMIGRLLGEIGHRIWWYSEDKHRDVDEEELMGMDVAEIEEMLNKAGYSLTETKRFVYGLNVLFVAEPL
jgi:SAM-dependent methyltransferase